MVQSREDKVRQVMKNLTPLIEAGQIKIVFRDLISGTKNDFELSVEESKVILEIFAAKYGVVSGGAN